MRIKFAKNHKIYMITNFISANIDISVEKF